MNRKSDMRVLMALVCVGLLSCSEKESTPDGGVDDTATGAQGDTDSDADSDADTDTDADTDI